MITLEGMTEEQEKELQQSIDETNRRSFAGIERIKPSMPVKQVVSSGLKRNLQWLLHGFTEAALTELNKAEVR